MKNNFFILLILLLINFKNVFAEQFKIEASKFELIDNKNLLIAYNGNAISSEMGLEIIANKFEYQKNLQLLKVYNGEAIIRDNNIKINFKNLIVNEKDLTVIANGDIKIVDLNNDLEIETESVSLDMSTNILVANGDVNINDIKNKLKIGTEKISIDKNNQIISSNTKSTLEDKFKNIFITEKFSYDKSKNLIDLFKVDLKDFNNNQFYIDIAKINVSSNNLVGKDISINLNNENFNKENEPRLKGRGIKYNNKETEITKGIFTTCKKTDSCPPWQLSAEKITHNKSKKKIDYQDVWLKIYDVPVVYFPKFFHPDPTVKRQSGFLMPSFKNSPNKDTFLSLPYFKVLSDNKDLTFTPRLYAKNKQLLQTEYRRVGQNNSITSDMSILAENNQTLQSHFFLDLNRDINLEKFDKSAINLKIQSVSNDTYLRANKLLSPLINNYDILETSIGINLYSNDLDINSDLIVYENLNKEDSDKFEYILPRINLQKKLENKTKLDGNFLFNSKNYLQNYNTNTLEKININDLYFKSNPRITEKGYYNNFEFIIKNTNTDTKNSSNFKEDGNIYLSTLFQFNSSLPLIKKKNGYKNLIKPKLSLKLSPKHTKNLRENENRIDVNNIFNLDRVSEEDVVEGGISLTYGNDFIISTDINSKEILSFKLANNIRLEENNDLPKYNQLGAKTSNLYGELKYSPNEILTTQYNFSTKNNFRKMNYENLSTEIKINNFVTKFDYLNENNTLDQNSYLLNKTEYNFDESNNISFSTRSNKKTNLTEYYNLMYQYKNDCLKASIEYNKQYYNDRDIKPEESVFLKLTIIPFGETSTPNLNN